MIRDFFGNLIIARSCALLGLSAPMAELVGAWSGLKCPVIWNWVLEIFGPKEVPHSLSTVSRRGEVAVGTHGYVIARHGGYTDMLLQN